MNVCELLKSANQFDGKVVVVSGFIYAAGTPKALLLTGPRELTRFI